LEKTIQIFVCQSCGAQHSRWQGKCMQCGEWNTLVEEAVTRSKRKSPQKSESEPVPIDQVALLYPDCLPSGMPDLDYVLGKGFVEGSVVLLGGEPGIGKSTLALQVAAHQAQNHPVLYVSGEESASQIYFRAGRVGALCPQLQVLTETNILKIVKAIRLMQPRFVILDSIQVVFHPDIPSVSGSVTQVRQCALELITVLKELHAVGLLIGHITKDGALAGPKVLEHLVDVILYFEGERNTQYRTIRSFKNRFSSTYELGLFEMKPEGLVAVDSLSGVFVEDMALHHSGAMISSAIEGTRTLLVEVQALVVHSGYGMAKRTFLGVDAHRANLMIAAIEKILGIRLSDQDIILNIVGGLKISDPALDLGIVLAILSSLQEKPMRQAIGVCGELSLTGDIRPVPHIEKRVLEFDRMGFLGCIIPVKNKGSFPESVSIKPYYVATLKEALEVFLSL
jgi:DNA repair protein RadA/Sms